MWGGGRSPSVREILKGKKKKDVAAAMSPDLTPAMSPDLTPPYKVPPPIQRTEEYMLFGLPGLTPLHQISTRVFPPREIKPTCPPPGDKGRVLLFAQERIIEVEPTKKSKKKPSE